MPKIALINVYKSIGKTDIVKDLTLEIEDGSSFVLAGPASAGKTMVLRMIAGLENVSKGEILIDGKKVNGISCSKRGVSLIFDDYALYPNMTVYENIAFGLNAIGMNRKEILGAIVQIAQELKIENFLGKLPKFLSPAQKQRAAIARALAKEPKILLFDSPLSNEQYKDRFELRADLKKFQQRIGFTAIYAVRNPIDAMALGDMVCLMNHGQTVQTAKPADIYLNPINKTAAHFIGAPWTNFIDIVIEEREGAIFLNAGSFEIAAPSELADIIKPYLNMQVELSLNAQHISDKPFGGETQNFLSAQIQGQELHGGIKYVYAFDGKNKLIFASPLSNDFSDGQELKLFMDDSKIRLFDPQTSERII
jgi:ABC-type sugar transport system ATPase subunit